MLTSRWMLSVLSWMSLNAQLGPNQEKQNNIIDWPFQWQVVFDAMRHRKAGTLRTLVPLPSVILQPFMRVQDQRKLMSTKGINVSENEWWQGIQGSPVLPSEGPCTIKATGAILEICELQVYRVNMVNDMNNDQQVEKAIQSQVTTKDQPVAIRVLGPCSDSPQRCIAKGLGTWSLQRPETSTTRPWPLSVHLRLRRFWDPLSRSYSQCSNML
jgi:hypothetical protein